MYGLRFSYFAGIGGRISGSRKWAEAWWCGSWRLHGCQLLLKLWRTWLQLFLTKCTYFYCLLPLSCWKILAEKRGASTLCERLLLMIFQFGPTALVWWKNLCIHAGSRAGEVACWADQCPEGLFSMALGTTVSCISFLWGNSRGTSMLSVQLLFLKMEGRTKLCCA